MKSNWKKVKLSDICDVRDGTHDSPKRTAEGRFLITSKHIKGGKIDLSSAYKISLKDFDMVNQRSKVDQWDILLSMIGTIGEVCIVKEEPDFAIKNVGLIKTNDEILSLYLYYYLKTPTAQSDILARLKGTTQQYLSLGEIRSFPISIPQDDRVMRKITKILSSIDDKIELNNKINQNLEAQAQAILYKCKSNLSKSEIGDYLYFINGFAFKSSSYVSNGTFKIVTIKNVKDGKIDSIGSDSINEIPYGMPPDCFLDIGDGLMSLTGNVGRIGIVCEKKLLLNQRVAKIVPRETAWKGLAYFIMRFPETKSALKSIAHGTAQANLSTNDSLKVKLSFPVDITSNFAKILNSYYIKIQKNNMGSILLAQLRDALLPKLMSGEIDVSGLFYSTIGKYGN